MSKFQFRLSFMVFFLFINAILTMILCPMWSSDVFTEDDWKLVQLVLTLFRNILAIQDITLQQKASGSATQFLCLRDRFLELLFQENVMDLILALTQHVAGSCGYLRQENMLLLETFYYIVFGQDPELIAKASQKGPKVCFLHPFPGLSVRYVWLHHAKQLSLI